jgi:3-oxoacyl-[acyl-carrier-protein] synthase III
MSGVFIAGSGMYVPSNIVTNDDMSKIVETSDEWISQRTGIRERRFSQGESNYFMGSVAARQAMDAAEVTGKEIDMIIATTCTPDYFYPNLACIVQGEIGAGNAFCWDLNAACTGFIYALDVAQHYLAMGKKNVLIVSSEVMSKQLDFTDRSTCVLFGDGAGAVVIKASDGMYASYLKSDGGNAKSLVSRALKTQGMFATDKDNPKYNKYEENSGHFIKMDGKDVYRFAVKAMTEAIGGACKNAEIDVSQLDLIIPHQANLRIIEAAAKRGGVSMDKIYANVSKYGNMSSACIPICLSELQEAGRLKRGDKLGLVGFGAGLTYGAAVLEW